MASLSSDAACSGFGNDRTVGAGALEGRVHVSAWEVTG